VKRNWKCLNIDSKSLLQKTVQFLEAKDFGEVVAVETDVGYRIVAGQSSHYKIRDDLSITIEGTPDDISIGLALIKKKRRPSLPMILTSMFGGGYFLLENLKSTENFRNFEMDFWKETNRILSSSGVSTNTQKNQSSQT
jgi:hypothetical protein